MSELDKSSLLRAIDTTWPAAERIERDGWVFRRGDGGGSRVSATTAQSGAMAADLVVAERQMDDWGQPDLFMITPEDAALDERLAQAGYQIKDPVTAYLAKVDALTSKPLPPVTTFVNWPPLAIARDIWQVAGIGPARQAIMARANGPKTCILGRCSDTPAAALFVASFGTQAFVHALEVRQEYRRQGLGRFMILAAAHWARKIGASQLGLLVTDANKGAHALYETLGMRKSAAYHYRIKPPV